MTEVEKSELPEAPDGLEHLARLADDRWREYESKSQAEWKLSYSVWATLLAATASILSQGENFPICRPVLVFAVISFAVLAFFVHKQFLDWVHGKLASLRQEMQTILERRRKLLSMPAVAADAGSGRESLRVQLWITALLGVLLIGVACMVST